MSGIDVTNWNQQDAEILKAKYELACEENKESFSLMGQEVLTSYAKYLIEYLESKGILRTD